MKRLAVSIAFVAGLLSCRAPSPHRALTVPSEATPHASSAVQPLAFAPPVLPAPNSVAKLFEARCSNCHDLPEPSQRSATEWAKVLAEMAPAAGLSEAESIALQKWLSAQHKDSTQ